MPGFLRCGLLALALSASSLSAAPLLYSLGTTDGMLYSLNSLSNHGVERTLFDVGYGYNGGLTFDPAANRFYAISNDMDGYSTLAYIQWDGFASGTMDLGGGFYGGLTYAGSEGQFYAIAAGRDGVQNNLFSIDLLNRTISHVDFLGTGDTSFDGGITYSPPLLPGSVGLSLIGMQFNDRGGFTTSLYSYSPLSESMVLDGIFRSVVFPAAGGLARDERGINGWALGIDPETGQQLLVSFNSTGIVSSYGLNSLYSGLVFAEPAGPPPPPPSGVPEPASLLLLTAGLGAIAICWRSRR